MTQTIKTLSQRETQLLSTLSSEGKNIFSFEDAFKLLKLSRGHAWKFIHTLVDKGWLRQIEKGKYLIVPLEGIAAGAWSEEAFVIAANLVAPYAISYWSALNYYGYTEQIPRTIFVSTTKRKFKAETEILGIPFKFITLKSHKFFGTTTIWFGNKRVIITDKEKTIVDSLDHPEYCGGIVEAAKGLANAIEDAIDLDKLTSYATGMKNRAIFKRLGYVSEVLDLPVKHYLNRWQKMVSLGYVLLDPLSAKTGTHNSRWHIQANVSKANLTGWRTH